MDAPTVTRIPAVADLAAIVDRARTLLDEGDVEAARMLADKVYADAKHAAGAAVRWGAGEKLVAKARRLQGEALLIEARAQMRLADEYDVARASGAAAAAGRPKKVPDGGPFSLSKAGLSKQEIHRFRKLRDAERDRPGIVERAIEARLAAGLEPSRANLRAAVGTDSASGAERGNNLYETPEVATRTLLGVESFRRRIMEPACGRGAIARVLEATGHELRLADLVDYGAATADGELQGVGDFMASTRADDFGDYDIVTNPPYGPALNAFVAHALRVHRPRKMALLLNLNFLAGFDDPERNFALDEAPPARIHVFTRRLPMMHRDGWAGPEASSRMNTAWFVWERNRRGVYAGRREVRRVDWKAWEGEG